MDQKFGVRLSLHRALVFQHSGLTLLLDAQTQLQAHAEHRVVPMIHDGFFSYTFIFFDPKLDEDTGDLVIRLRCRVQVQKRKMAVKRCLASFLIESFKARGLGLIICAKNVYFHSRLRCNLRHCSNCHFYFSPGRALYYSLFNHS